MFAPSPQMILQQQFMQGCAIGQQGAMCEMTGNLAGACQMYDQAAAVLGNCIAAAQQYMVPVDDQGWFSLAWCHFNAARTKTLLGWGSMAPLHLSHSQSALNNAIALNPAFPQYHSAMGVLLAATGQIVAAAQAFTRAVQLNPGDAFSQYMLALIHQSQGNIAMGNQYFAAAQQHAPNLPPPAQTVQAQGKSGGFDWNGLIGTVGQVAKLLNSAFFSTPPSTGAIDNNPQGWSGGGYGWGGGGGYGW